MAKGWLDNYGKEDNYNDSNVSAPEGFQGDGYSNVGRNYSPAWGGQFQMGGNVYPVNYVPQAAMGGSLPGATGHMYARIGAPSNGKYAKKTLASAQNGAWLDDYDVAQTGINASKFKEFGKSNSPQSKLQRSTTKEEASEDYRRWTDSSEYKNQVRSNKLAEDKATVKGRKDRINKSMAAQKKSFTKDNWRQQLADETQAIGDKFRIFPEDPDSFIDEWMNPGVLLGDMASDLGSAPLRAQQEDSYMPYVTSIGTPLLTGALEGLGAKTTGQFISNVVNPLNVVPGYHAVEAELPNILKKGVNNTKKSLARGALTTLEGLRDVQKLGKEVIQGIDDNVIYPIKYRKEIKNIKDIHNNIRTKFESKAGANRFKKTLGIDVADLDYPTITTTPGIGSNYSWATNNVNIDVRRAVNRDERYFMNPPESVHSHEMGHWMGREMHRNSADYKRALSDYKKELTEYNSPKQQAYRNLDLKTASPDEVNDWLKNAIKTEPSAYPPISRTSPTPVDAYAKKLYNYDDSTGMIDISHVDQISNPIAKDNAEYFTHRGVEPIAHLREMRQNMKNKGYIDDIYDPISNETIAKFIKENPGDRISSFTKDDYDKISGLGSIFKTLPSVVGAGAVGAAAVNSVEQKREGGVIKDDMGQWTHPGEVTEINSNDITMEGVPYDVLGISDTGDTKLMKPGKNYKFKGKKVTEYPMAKNGLRQEQKGLQNLDQLTNFTNYNTKQPGGWLDTL